MSRLGIIVRETRSVFVRGPMPSEEHALELVGRLRDERRFRDFLALMHQLRLSGHAGAAWNEVSWAVVLSCPKSDVLCERIRALAARDPQSVSGLELLGEPVLAPTTEGATA